MPKTSLIRSTPHVLESAINAQRITCAFSVRTHKNMSLSYGDTSSSLDNRKDFLAGIGIPYQDLVCAKQVHGSNVRYVKEEERGSGALSYENSLPDTDAFITDKLDVPLAIFTADCLSVFLYDPRTPAVGLVHAGWRSTKGNIAGKTVELMKKQCNTAPEGLYAGFGPAIRECCYEVSADFRGYFTYGLRKRNDAYYLDLIGINKKQLIDAGVKEAHIFDSRKCTSCQNQDLFSFRKERESCGRMMSVIMMKE